MTSRWVPYCASCCGISSSSLVAVTVTSSSDKSLCAWAEPIEAAMSPQAVANCKIPFILFFPNNFFPKMLCTREACLENACEPGAENGLGEFAGRMRWVPKACPPRVPTETKATHQSPTAMFADHVARPVSGLTSALDQCWRFAFPHPEDAVA